MRPRRAVYNQAKAARGQAVAEGQLAAIGELQPDGRGEAKDHAGEGALTVPSLPEDAEELWDRELDDAW